MRNDFCDRRNMLSPAEFIVDNDTQEFRRADNRNGSIVNADGRSRIKTVGFDEGDQDAFSFSRIQRKLIRFEPGGDFDKLIVEDGDKTVKARIREDNSGVISKQEKGKQGR